MQNILVTGSAGFIGGDFVLDWLVASGKPVDKLTFADKLFAVADYSD